MSSPSPDKSARQALMIARGLSRGIGLASGGKIDLFGANGPIDTAQANIPLGRRGRNIDADISRNVAAIKAQELSADRIRRAQFRSDKEAAKALYARHGPSMLASFTKLDPKKAKAHVEGMVKWEPSRFLSLLDRHLKEREGKASGGDVRGSWDRITGKDTAWPDEDMPEDSMPLPSLSREDFREPRTQRNPFERASGGSTKALTQAMNRFAQARQDEFARDRAGILSSDPWLRTALPASD